MSCRRPMPSHACLAWCGRTVHGARGLARRGSVSRAEERTLGRWRPLSAASPARRPPHSRHSRPQPRDAAIECTLRASIRCIHATSFASRAAPSRLDRPPHGPPPSRSHRGSDGTSRASRVPASQLTVKSSSESGEAPRSAVPPDESRLASGRAPDPTDEPEFHSDEPTCAAGGTSW